MENVALDRRGFLRLGASAFAALALPSLASAPAQAEGRAKIGDVTTTSIGTTLELTLTHAPFPFRGSPWSDQTVLAFVPKHYRAPKGARFDALVHFHGHNTTARDAIASHALREQLYESKQNAVLLVPQGPVRAAESPPGKLGEEGGLRRMLAEAATVLSTSPARRALGASAVGASPRLGLVVLSAHSGGYRPAAACLRSGGIDVQEAYLFDALYGEVSTYRDWVVARKGATGRERHKLVSHFVSQAVRKENLALEAALTAAGVACTRETVGSGVKLSRAELTRARVLLLDGQASHSDVTYQSNQLRDCLYASCFDRLVSSTWFDDKNAPRRIDPRTKS
jgi:hypothetical protein